MKSTSVFLLLILGVHASAAPASDLASEVAELRQLLAELQLNYESRISDLEARLSRAEQLASGARRRRHQAQIGRPSHSRPPSNAAGEKR